MSCRLRASKSTRKSLEAGSAEAETGADPFRLKMVTTGTEEDRKKAVGRLVSEAGVLGEASSCARSEPVSSDSLVRVRENRFVSWPQNGARFGRGGTVEIGGVLVSTPKDFGGFDAAEGGPKLRGKSGKLFLRGPKASSGYRQARQKKTPHRPYAVRSRVWV